MSSSGLTWQAPVRPAGMAMGGPALRDCMTVDRPVDGNGGAQESIRAVIQIDFDHRSIYELVAQAEKESCSNIIS